MTAIFATLFGVALVATPIVARALGEPLSAGESAALFVTGTLVLAATGLLATLTKLYQRTKASEAFVRTGLGGAYIVRDGGALIAPFVHELVRVSLQTIKLDIDRENEDALITHDKLRADVRAEFYVRVQPDEESILQASRSLGERMGRAADVKELVEDKLVSALRTAAASRSLDELNSERDEFLADVMRLVAEDLRSNGLVLETVTISRLDQTDERFLRDGNIFDAQGRRKIAEITQQNLTERNRHMRDGEQVRKQQDVAARQQSLELEKAESEAEARQAAEVQRIRAQAGRDAELEAIGARRQVELADVEKHQAVAIASRQQEQAIEIAEREKQERIAEAEQKRATAECGLATAEAERERARQQVETVRVREDAERSKTQKVLEAEGEAEKAFVAEQRRADAEAYSIGRQAEARKLAADAESSAIRKQAEAESDAERLRAVGELARAMVPIDVRRAEVEIDRDRIDTVVRRELEAREQHGRVAQEFEVAKLRIEAEKEVRIAVASAQASLFTKMTANLYGTPADLARITESLTKGQSAAELVNGFLGHADERTRDMLSSIGDGLAKATSAVVSHAKPTSTNDAPEPIAVASNGVSHAAPALAE